MTGHLRVNGIVVKLQHKQKATDALTDQIPANTYVSSALWGVSFDEARLLRNIMNEFVLHCCHLRRLLCIIAPISVINMPAVDNPHP